MPALTMVGSRLLGLLLKVCDHAYECLYRLLDALERGVECLVARTRYIAGRLCAKIELRYVLSRVMTEPEGWVSLRYGTLYEDYGWLARQLLRRGFKIVMLRDGPEDEDDLYPEELLLLVGHGKEVVLFWKYKVIDHLDVEWRPLSAEERSRA